MQDTIIITAGGTGGHLFPAVSLGEEFSKINPDVQVILVGTSVPMDREIFEASGFDWELLPLERPVPGFSGKIRTVTELIASFIKSSRWEPPGAFRLSVVLMSFGAS